MIRFVIIGLAVLMVWLLALAVWRFFKTRRIDWAGICFAVGFVTLAFYLRQMTGLG